MSSWGEDRIGTGADARATGDALSLPGWKLFAIFAIEAVAIEIARLPIDMGFSRFAFFDYGANLTLQPLISAGYKPAIDFGYAYSLLGPLIGGVWFGFLGSTPAAYEWAMLTGAILFGWAIARIFAGRKVGVAGLALLILSFGFAFQSSYPLLTHCVEGVLIAHAIASQIRGSYRGALALATAAVLVKPSMGYVYGALLLILIILELRRKRGTIRDFIGEILPAGIAFAVLSTVLIAVYGGRSFLLTTVPITGVTTYRALGFGFLVSGKYLWYPKAGPAAYFLDIPGFWMASTLYLAAAAVVQAADYIRGKLLTRSGEAIITCAILHLAFVTLFFGPSVSWYYYSFIPVIGCVLATETGSGWRRAAVILCVLSALSWCTTASTIHFAWRNTSPNPETAGLWSLDGEASEWNKVVGIAHEKKMVVVDTRGGVEVMYPEFGAPVKFFLAPGVMTKGEIARTAARLSAAEAYVVPTVIRQFEGLPDAPEITAAMKDFDLEWKGYYFEVYRRRAEKAESR